MYKCVWDLYHCKQDAEDIVQIVWEKLIAKENTLRKLAHGQRINYISKTVENTIKEIQRKKRPVVCSLEQTVEPIYDGTRYLEGLYNKRMQYESFHDAWILVDAPTRELLERKYCLEETDEDISRAMNISKQSVRMYLTRARRKAFTVLASSKNDLL